LDRLKPALNSLNKWSQASLDFFFHYYNIALEYAVNNRRKVLAIISVCTSVNLLILFLFIQRETMPDVDQNQFLMNLSLPTGTRLEVTDAVVRRIEDQLAKIPEVAHRNVIVGAPNAESSTAMGPNQAQVVIDLADEIRAPGGKMRPRRRRAREVMQDVGQKLTKLDLEGGRVEYIAQGGDVFSQLFGKAGADLVIEVKGQSLKSLKELAEKLERDLKSVKGVSKISSSLTVPSLQMKYQMDELRLARDGLSVSEVAEVVLAGVHGIVPTKFRELGKEVNIRLRLREEDRKDTAALSRLMLSNPMDKTSHPLSEYGALDVSPGPSEIRRRDQSRTILLSVYLSGRRLPDALPDVQKLLGSYRNLRDGSVGMGGEVEEMQASFMSLVFGFAASVVLVYIVLVAQFNTLWIPLLAMVAVPLSVNGVAPALLLSGHTLNLMSGQGLMILAGIVVNNSLMLLEFIQQRREQGRTPEQAALEASRTRIRPIFMTIIGNLAGLLPLALGIGKGAEMQAPMAITVIFGLLVSTAMTLIVMPAVFLEARAIFERD
ncbi:MAG: efflux RND transporter permease subunit, partial [Elusimicrobia bacterium]|nr:efflux RND transporter permease subunit [Elusimicrobiota bacterium]